MFVLPTGSFHLYPVKLSYCGKSYCDLQMLEGLPHLMGSCLRINMKRFKEFQKSSRRLTYLYLFFTIVCNSWDTEFNPGPASLSSSHFPCGVCGASVGWDDRAIVCDTCNKWYHIDCQGVNSNMYSIYNQSLDRSLAWECLNCGMPNFSTSLFDTLGLIDTSYRFDSLSIPDSPIPTELGTPTRQPDNIHSTVRLFADDCVLYRNIRRSEDQQILQDDLDRLAHWEEAWLMKFNVAKCHSMRVTRHPPPKQIVYGYTLHNQVLENVSSAKYLGVKITDDLEWGQHINGITNKATKTLGFLRRNLTFAPKETKAAAYKTLVRPKLEYAAPVWMPYHQVDNSKVGP